MARMIPKMPEDFHGSPGEARVFRALRALPDDVIVIHSLRWLNPGNVRLLARHLEAQGEGDFVLLHPARGILVVEVKGGDVWCEQGEWFQRNRRNNVVQPTNPEAQASNTMFRIRAEVLKRIPQSKNVLFCHAVWFPDGVVDRKCLPLNYHPDMTLDSESLAQPSVSLDRAFSYWKSLHPHRGGTGDLTESILNVLAPTFSIVRSVRSSLQEREEAFIQLTGEQIKVIDFLDEQSQAAVHGAAGTGKTLLALEKAKRIATPTEPVLFLCFNAALRDHLRANHAHANVSYHTFHGLAREIIGPDGSLDDAAEALIEHLSRDGPLPYAHLIIDEAQDFDRDWLEFLRYRFREGTFYVFYDRYQAVQGQKDTAWLDDIPCRLVLTRNCRNTDPIARVAYRAGGLGISPKLGLDGPQPVLHTVVDRDEAAKVAEAKITTLEEEAASASSFTLDRDPRDRSGDRVLARLGLLDDALVPGTLVGQCRACGEPVDLPCVSCLAGLLDLVGVRVPVEFPRAPCDCGGNFSRLRRAPAKEFTPPDGGAGGNA